MSDIFDQINATDDVSPLDGALEAGEIFEIAAEFGDDMCGSDMLAAIDGDISLDNN